MAPVERRPQGEGPERIPLTARLLLRGTLSARRAAGIIALFTVVITIAGGLLVRLIDHREYHTLGKGLWFALQTVTTVGYGDATPRNASGRIVATVVMLTGIGFLAVITAALVQGSRRRYAQTEIDLERRLDEMNERLSKIEEAVGRTRPD